MNKLVVGSPARRERLDPIHFPVEEFAPHRRARLEEDIGRVLDEVERQIEELEVGRLHVRELVVEQERRPVVEQEQTPPQESG